MFVRTPLTPWDFAGRSRLRAAWAGRKAGGGRIRGAHHKLARQLPPESLATGGQFSPDRGVDHPVQIPGPDGISDVGAADLEVAAVRYEVGESHRFPVIHAAVFVGIPIRAQSDAAPGRKAGHQGLNRSIRAGRVAFGQGEGRGAGIGHHDADGFLGGEQGTARQNQVAGDRQIVGSRIPLFRHAGENP